MNHQEKLSKTSLPVKEDFYSCLNMEVITDDYPHNDLLFLPERIKIKKVEELLANLHEKEEQVVHIRNLKQALKHGFVLKKCIESLDLFKKLG